MDVKKQIAYWHDGAAEDIEAAQVLIEKRKLRHGLFFAHLALEKMLKAHVVHATQDIPPRIHNLVRLAQLSGLALTTEQKDFLRQFNIYNLEGRYPDEFPVPIGEGIAQQAIASAREMLKWLKVKF